MDLNLILPYLQALNMNTAVLIVFGIVVAWNVAKKYYPNLANILPLAKTPTVPVSPLVDDEEDDLLAAPEPKQSIAPKLERLLKAYTASVNKPYRGLENINGKVLVELRAELDAVIAEVSKK